MKKTRPLTARRKPAGARSDPPAMPFLIARKRDGGVLADAEIAAIIGGAATGEIPDYQLAALLMAIVWRGLDEREMSAWLHTMIASGDRLRLEGIAGRKIDKHSTGGVGDKVSLCLAPLVAACGVAVPMISGRALGHTGGTLDKLEAIPGFRVNPSPVQYRRLLDRVGFVMAGQTANLVPADKVLYALRDATATVESIPLIASSILSKKIAGGADALVMDVKVGDGAFLPRPRDSFALARTIVALGNRAGLQTVAWLTDMDEPLGEEIGNASEVREAIAILRGDGPRDTLAVTVRLGAEMLRLAGVVRDRASGRARIMAAIASGAGLDRLRLSIELQGGDPRVVDQPGRLALAGRKLVLRAPRSGTLGRVGARAVGLAATVLGSGRLRKEDRVDPAVGITLHARGGDRVEAGQALCTVWYNDASRLQRARPFLAQAFVVGENSPPARRLFRGFVE